MDVVRLPYPQGVSGSGAFVGMTWAFVGFCGPKKQTKAYKCPQKPTL
jgi:hypothetical protein